MGNNTLTQICVIENCNKKLRQKNSGYCNMHYARNYRHGNPYITKTTKDGTHNGYIYHLYYDILSRCHNLNNKVYYNYGGRGISVFAEWREKNGFEKFRSYILSELGHKPSSDYTLDRIDNDKGYEPGNIRWANRLTQIINRRRSQRSSSGFMGVYWDKPNRKWRACIGVKNKNIGLGRFDTLEEAVSARLFAESYYGHTEIKA